MHLPFNFLLNSLADEYAGRAVCVVLSGTGSDGCVGLKAVHEKGGLVIAQQPAEAAYAGMPRSAIATGAVDLVLPVGDIPPVLARHARLPHLTANRKSSTPNDQTDASLAPIIDLVRARTAHDFTPYKRATLVRRIQRRMGLAALKDAGDYLELLRKNAAELELLTKDLLIHVTRFFRDPAAFEALAKIVIPELIRNHAPDQPIRIWVPACSTGEEAYSLAMLFLEELASANKSTKLQIFASDASPEAVAEGRNGLFPETIKADVSAERLARFFTPESHGYRVRRELRDSIVFTVQDLLTDPPFSRLDLISCRNLLIYLQPDEQERVVSLFHRALRPGGLLLLGTAETVGKLTDLFEPVSNTIRVFRRIGADQPREQALASNIRELARSLWPRIAGHVEPKRASLSDFAQRLVLEVYAPASVLVNRKYQGFYFMGPIDRYMRVAPGEPSRFLPAMLREGLAAKFQEAVRQASQTHAAVTIPGARIRRDRGSILVSISSRPVQHEGEELLLVSFVEEPEHTAVPASESPAEATRAVQLHQELQSTRQELESTIRELNASNQELTELNEEALSLNEEFQSTNEELETSKEELQSLNEELTTANNQLQDSFERQRNTSNDLKNILNSSQVATLFVDRDLRVRFFTPAAAPLFNLIATDIGRPLSDLAVRFTDIDIVANARTVLDNLTPIQREIKSGSGTWYLCGLSPYRTQDDHIDGVVVNLADISALKASEDRLQAARAYTTEVIGSIQEPLVVLDRELRVEGASASFYALFGGSPEGSSGQPLLSIDVHHLDVPALRALLERVKSSDDAIESCEITVDPRGRGERKLLAAAQRIRGASAAEEKILLSFSDVTDLAARQAAEIANLAKSRFLAAASHDLRQPLQTLGLLLLALRQRIRDGESLAVLGNAERTLKAMSATLNVLLDLNQIESGVLLPKPTDFPINEILSLLKSEFAELATSKGLHIRVVPCGLTVRSDRHLLEEMVRNLVSNAVRYTDAGTILLGCRRHGDKVRIEVWDTGIGIAEEQISHIFQQYGRGADQPREGSLGLGLAIVHELARALNHPVGVRSVVGKGSVFSIELPVVPAGSTGSRRPELGAFEPPAVTTSAALPPVGPSVAASELTLFVVDDDRGAREAIQLVLTQAGYSVRTFGSAAGFLESYRPGQRGCLITDVLMPGMNGFELLARLATAGQTLPAIVITGQGDIAMAVEAMKAGAVDFIEKPTDSNALLASVDRALRQAASPAERSSWRRAAALRVAGLTKREREVLDLVVSGVTNKDISARLGIHQRTVETHRAAAMSKMGASSLSDLVRLTLAARSGEDSGS